MKAIILFTLSLILAAQALRLSHGQKLSRQETLERAVENQKGYAKSFLSGGNGIVKSKQYDWKDHGDTVLRSNNVEIASNEPVGEEEEKLYAELKKQQEVYRIAYNRLNLGVYIMPERYQEFNQAQTKEKLALMDLKNKLNTLQDERRQREANATH